MMKTFSMTDIGRHRETNQDYLFSSETAVGNLPNLFLVADGMGGHAAGDFASRYTVEKIVEGIRGDADTEPVALLKAAIAEANAGLIAEAAASPERAGMGTTVVGASMDGDRLYAANVGDSRLYIVNRAEIRQITRDHSLVQEMVRMGEMEKNEAVNHPDKNIITRAVGVMPEVTVDFFETTLSPGDMVLMCTDGLTNMVSDEEIRHIILTQRDIVEQVEMLVRTANEHGGKDNITVVLVEPFAE